MSTQLPPPPGTGPAWTRSLGDPPRLGVVAKALSLAVFAGMIAGVLGTFALVVLWGALFVGERLDWVDEAAVSTILTNGRTVVTWLAVVLTVWAGGYGTTVRGSGPRIVVGLALGLPIGLAIKALGSPAWTVAAVGIGWAVAIPARSVRIAGIRMAPLLLLGLASVPLAVVGPTAELGAGLVGVLVAGVVVLIMISSVEPRLHRRLQSVSRKEAEESDGPEESHARGTDNDDPAEEE